MTSTGVTASRLLSLLRPARLRRLGVNPCDPAANFRGGIQYDPTLDRKWAAARDPGERRGLTFASYDAGIWNVETAVALVGAASWRVGAALLERVTGRHAGETTVYVRGIKRTYLRMR